MFASSQRQREILSGCGQGLDALTTDLNTCIVRWKSMFGDFVNYPYHNVTIFTRI